MNKDRLRELALAAATAKAAAAVLMLRGIPYQDAEREYQQAVHEFDAALDAEAAAGGARTARVSRLTFEFSGPEGGPLE